MNAMLAMGESQTSVGDETVDDDATAAFLASALHCANSHGALRLGAAPYLCCDHQV
jgi:hypothetical protein